MADPTPEARPPAEDVLYGGLDTGLMQSQERLVVQHALRALRAAGYVIVSQEEAEASRLIREVLSADIGFSTGVNDIVAAIRAGDDGFDCYIDDDNGEHLVMDQPTRYDALLAACREAQQDAIGDTRREGE